MNRPSFSTFFNGQRMRLMLAILTDQLLVFRMWTNPKPISRVSDNMSQRAVISVNTSTPNFADFLEMKGWMVVILPPQVIGFTNALLNISWQQGKTLSKLRSCRILPLFAVDRQAS